MRRITTAAARRSIGGLSDDLMNVAFDDEIRLADDIQDVRHRLADITQTLAIETAAFSITHALDRALASGPSNEPSGLGPGPKEIMT